MHKKLISLSELIVFLIICSCIPYEFDPDFPFKDDPTTVGNFKTSKFEGFWKVKNTDVDWNNPPVYDYQPLLYVFRQNTIQNFGGYRDWSNNDKLGEMTVGSQVEEFLYSNTAIYTEAFYNYRTWDKTYYKFSSNDDKLTLGRNLLEKIDIQLKKKIFLVHGMLVHISDTLEHLKRNI